MNIQPGMGLGFTASKQVADGLGTDFIAGVIEVIEFTTPGRRIFYVVLENRTSFIMER